jgi:C4-dicarboxylate-specific signal transduction histidine kinase
LANDSASPELKAALGEVAEQSRRAAEIVRSIRRTVRRADAERGPIDLNDAVRAVTRLLDWKARRTGVSVELNLAPDPLAPTYGDRVQLEQVVFNLLQNAIEAVDGRETRTVRIETRTEGDMVAVRVLDSGAGVTDPEKLFERFFTTKPDGMGLGLAISRSVVTAHGGTLTAATRPEGGAVFTCVLPIYREETA